jgi:hypothetical protein
MPRHLPRPRRPAGDSQEGARPHEAVDAAKKALKRVVDEWYDRVLLGARWPKKYFVAKMIEAAASPEE